ncbi:MAG: MliC family protein [Alphaproteobacteria bacterium]
MSIRAFTPLALALLIAACGSIPGLEKPAKDPSLPIPAKMASPPPPEEAVFYTCENGVKFKATFSDESGTVRIEPQAGALYTLYIAATSSGFAYADGGRELRGKGDEAMWTDKDKPMTKCTAMPAG